MIAENNRKVNSYSSCAQRFLATLHAGSDHYFLQYRTPQGKLRTQWFRVGEPFVIPAHWPKDANIYYGVSGTSIRVTNKDRAKPQYAGKPDHYIEPYVASKNETLKAVNAAFIDADGKDFTDPTPGEVADAFATLRANPDKAKSTDKALWNEAFGAAKLAKYITDRPKYDAMCAAHVAQLDPAPSHVVNSGGGLQAYWIFDQPFLITCEADLKKISTFQAGWVKRMGGDPGAKDPRRILRLPGTYNFKKAYAPNYPQVHFVKADFDLTYRFDELSALLPKPEPATTKPPKVTGKPTQSASETDAHYEGDSVIHAYNAKHKIVDVLLAQGYTQSGDRLSRPGNPESAGVIIDLENNRSQHWGGGDALCDPHWRRPFDVFCTYAYNGNVRAAVAAAAVELNMAKTPVDVAGTVERVKLSIRTHSFEGHAPSSADGVYRTDAIDTKIADAVLDAMQEDNRLVITIGKKRLAKLAGVSPNTAQTVLTRLNGWLFDITSDPFGSCVTLVEKCRLQQFDPLLDVVISLTIGGQNSENDKLTGVLNEYSPRKATDPFLSGISRHVKHQMRDTATALDITGKEALEQFTFKGLGESGLRVLDALLRVGEMTAQELAEETGKKLSSIRNACGRMVEHGLLEATREGSRGPNVYGVADDVWAQLEAITPHLRTYKLSAQREAQRLESAQQWTQAEIEKAKKAGEVEKAQGLERRFAKQAKQRIPHLSTLHPDLSAKEIERLAYEVAAYKRSPEREAAVRENRTQAQGDKRATIFQIISAVGENLDADITAAQVFDNVTAQGFHPATVQAVMQNKRMMHDAAGQAGNTILMADIAQLRATGASDKEITHQLEYAGFIPSEIKQAMTTGLHT
jgi:DNA-binding transcriptional regulator GbsR (MarR family)